MKIASISQTKNQLSHYLELVRHGEIVIIQDRGKPVAQLGPMPPSSASAGDDERLGRLERLGLMTRPQRKLPVSYWTSPLPMPKKGGELLRVVLEERSEGR